MGDIFLGMYINESEDENSEDSSEECSEDEEEFEENFFNSTTCLLPENPLSDVIGKH